MRKGDKKTATKRIGKKAARGPNDIPATYEALYKFRSELKSDISAVREETRAGFKTVDARFDRMDARFAELGGQIAEVRAELGGQTAELRAELGGQIASVRAQMSDMGAEIAKVNSTLEKMEATNNRMLALIEEQNSRNKASYEGGESVRERQDALTKRVDALEEFQHDISTRLKTN